MGSPDQTVRPPGPPRACDLVALSDAELDYHLEQNRFDDGGLIDIDVEDPENLPEEFIQRLRDKARDRSNAVRSGAVNLDAVNARLELVGAGGRPMYPIEMVDHVAEDPRAYRHLLRPWCTSAEASWPDWFVIFRKQLYHWECFRRWQAYNRDIELPDEDRWFYVDRAFKYFNYYFRRETSSYSEAASRLLAEHNFTRPVVFHQDSAQQDKLTEWIEYLTFECSVHTWYTRSLKRLQKFYDEDWQKVVASGLLRPYETAKYICTLESGHEYQKENDQLMRDRKMAESVLEAVQRGPDNPNARCGPRPTPLLTVTAATSMLNEAMEAWELFRRRRNLHVWFIRETAGFYGRQDDIQRQDYLLEWIMSQVPLVEAELRESSASEGGPGSVRDVAPTAEGDAQGNAAVSHIRTRKRARDEAARSTVLRSSQA
ncbi:hypothetical protein N0V88_001487 [Collariella sp. IMI 366227]|nr:hypothetical protein N0V88_001487 [Collariella sp. IMI 366227]